MAFTLPTAQEIEQLNSIQSKIQSSSWADTAAAAGLGIPEAQALWTKYTDTRGQLVIPDASGVLTQQQAQGFQTGANGEIIGAGGGVYGGGGYTINYGTPAAVAPAPTDALGVVGGSTNSLTNYAPAGGPDPRTLTAPATSTPGAFQSMQDMWNAGYNLNTPAPSQSVVSSQPARDQYTQNLGSLSNIEAGFTSPGGATPRDYSPMKPGESMDAYKARIGITAGTGQGGANTGQGQGSAGAPAITIQTANAAMANIVQQANSIVQQAQAMGIPLTPESQALLNKINGIQDQQNSLTSQARTAVNNPAVVNTSMAQVQQLETQKQTAIDSLMSQLAPLRQQILDSMNPSLKEQQLNQQLANLRNNATLSNIALANQTVPMPFIVGQQREQAQLYAAQEANLLTALGLEKDAEAMKTKTLEQQYSFIMDDIKLQEEIQARLDQKEQQLVENARQLSNDSLTALGKITDTFKGLGYSDLNATQQQQLQQFAQQYNIPISLLQGALDNAKHQLILDNAKKAATGTGGFISLSEAKSLGLPVSVVGMSQAEILASVQSSSVPSWFKQYAENQTQSSMTPQALQTAWEEFRQKVLAGSTGRSL